MANVNRTILFPILWPLGTTAPAARPAWAAWTLMGLNLAMLAALFVLPGTVMEHGMLPLDGRFYQYLTYSVTHANLVSGLLSVMLIWAYAPALENRLGPWLLLALYGAAALIGAVADHFLQAGQAEPLAGASAAICGLIGATLVLFPRAMVRFYAAIHFLLAPIFARVLLIHVAAFAMLYVIAELLLIQLEQAADLPYVLGHSVFSLSAHLGGLAAGAALAALLRRTAEEPAPALPRRIRDEAEALKPMAVIHEPLGPYRKAAAPPASQDAEKADALAPLATLTEVDPEPEEAAEVPPLPAPDEAAFERLFRQRLLFDDDEEEALAVVPNLGGAQPAKKPAPELFPEPADDEVISFDESDPGRDEALGGKPAMRQAEATHPPLIIPHLEAPPGHADEAAHPEGRERPAMREPYDVHRAPVAHAQAQEEPPAKFEIHLETSEDTQQQARELRDTTAWPDLKSGRFAVILAPGRPLNLAPIVEIMARTMGLAPQKAYGKLLRRRGILADNLGGEEAEAVATEFARAGHPVLVAALTSRIEFGEGLDLVEVQDLGEQVRFKALAQTIPAAWHQVVFLAAGEVSLRPGLPGQTVLDLFLVQPPHHLRLWDNTFSYAREAPRFRPMAELVTHKALRAIHTSSLDKWLRGEKNTLHRFGSMIEYDHYLRWHLLAHLAPTKQFRQG